jgi:hypothetical protein
MTFCGPARDKVLTNRQTGKLNFDTFYITTVVITLCYNGGHLEYLYVRERILYYNAMIKPMILYGSAVWTTTSKENLNRVLKIQKRAARVILDLNTSARSVNMFKQLNWIPYYDEMKILKATTAYKCINSESPDYLANMLKLNSSVNSRATRYSNLNFLCPKYKRETEGGRTFYPEFSNM